MHLTIRTLLILWALPLLVLTEGFAMQAPWATWLWPWPDGPLSYLWVGSILAAVAGSILFVGFSGELAALRSGALDFAVSYAGIAVFLTFLFPNPQGLWLTPWIIGAWASLGLNLLIWLLARRVPWQDTRPAPTSLRWVLLGLGLILIAVATALLLKTPAVFPWPLKPETSVLIGWLFLGAAVYMLYGFFKPVWGNVAGQLWGFAAYDLVLLGPYLRHFQTVKPEHWLSLAVFVTVVVGTLLLALWYLLLHPATGILHRPRVHP